uniref:Adenylyl cyclase-associated protein n=1 Tax=Caenorhabditis japonica TaxID=281687 RepID=A0A8R1HT34_CAEJA
MDSLYYSAPRPFNKFPRGYRPVTDSTQDLTRGFGGGGLRPSNSWSSFPQQSDQRSSTLPHFPSTCVSPVSPVSLLDRSINNWVADEPARSISLSLSRRPLRSESSSTVFDNAFSPRELSPLSVASEYCNNPMPPPAPMYGHRSVQSPVQASFQEQIPPRGYDNVPRPIQPLPPPPAYEPPQSVSTSQRETDFLRNLQRQKSEARNMSSSWYGGDQASRTRQLDWDSHLAYPDTQPQHQQQQRVGEGSGAQPPYQSEPRRIAKTQSDLSIDTPSRYPGDQPSRQPDWTSQSQLAYHNPPPHQQEQEPRRISKTRSDLSFDALNNTYFNNNNNNPGTGTGTLPRSQPQNQNQNPYSPSNPYLNNGVPNGSQPHRMDGFFRNRVIEPNWMTDPPPPKSFREDYIIRKIPLSTSINSDFERFRLDPNYREPRASTEQPNSNFRSYHRDGGGVLGPEQEPSHVQVQGQSQPQHYQRGLSQERSPPVLSYAQQPAPFTFPNPINQINYNQPPHQHQQQQQQEDLRNRYHQKVPLSQEPKEHTNVYQNVPTPVAVNYRNEREERESNRNSAVYPNEPIRLTNDRVLRIHPHQVDQEEAHFSPPQAQSHRARIQSPLRDFARLTSPIREVAPLPTPDRIFSPVESKVYNRSVPTVINGFTSNRHTYNSHTDDYDARNRRDSSQPPVAVIEPNINVHMPSDPIPYQKPHFGHHHHQHHNQNIQHVKPSTNTPYYQNVASSATFSPTSTSNYEHEHDSDLDIEEMARRALPKYLRDNDHAKMGRHSNLYGDNLHGILIKNPSLHRSSSKKVVFIDQEKASAAAGSGEAPPHVRAYDDAIEEPLARWGQLSDELGGDLAAVKPKVLAAFDSFRNSLWAAAGKVEPSAEEAAKMLTPIIKILEDLTNFKATKKNTTFWNHLNSIVEALPALGWLTVKKTPAPYVKEYIDAAQFYINPILREHKEKDPRHVEWTKAWKGIFEEMQKFVRQTHTTGLVWNSAPGSVPPADSSAAPVAALPAPKGPGGPPPPPPPPIPANLLANIAPPAVDADKASRDALFASLNQGEAITSKLKKVTADMQTHKNPALRGNTAAPATAGSGNAGGSPAKAATPVRKPPHKELENGKQWIVEYFVNEPNIVIDVADKKQTVYIFRCENSVIKVNGKANSITLDGCKKTSVVFDALVAQCETVNCQSVQIQTLGELPTLSIQKTDGCQVYLSKVAQGCEIVTSKSSEMNISVQTNEDGDYTEFPVPEQFKTTFVNGKLVTVVSDIC